MVNTDLLRRIPFGRFDELVKLPEFADALLKDINNRGPKVFEEVMHRFPGRAARRGAKKHAAAQEIGQLAKLDIPKGRPFGDDFYRAVADHYRAALRQSSAPASVIAERNNVAVTQVHRWVKVARNKGFLSKGQQGKAG